MRVSAFVFVLLGQVVASTHAADPTDWTGVKVLPKEDCVIKIENTVLDIKDFTLPYVVQKARGEWLWIGGTKKGWVHRSQVVTMEEAPGYYTQVINSNRNKFRAYYLRGWAWQEKGEFELAIADYGECLRLDPNDARTYLIRGIAWDKKNDHDKAIADFNQAIRLDPNLPYAYNSRGTAWGIKKEYEKAIEDHNQAIRLDPNFVGAYNSRGNAWFFKKDCEKAIEDYNQAIRLDPNFAGAYNNRGAAWSDKKDYDKAIADFNEAIRLDPNCAAAYDNRGLAWGNKKEYDEAIEDYNRAIQLEPNYANAYNGVAWIRATNPDAKYRDGQEAVKLATKACELTGWKNGDQNSTLAAAYAEAGDFENAIKYQHKAIELNPSDSAYEDRLKLYQSGKPYRD